MKILTFSGKSPADALKKAQMQVGEEAMLIETKEIQKKALGREALYEIIVGIEEDRMQAVRKKPEVLRERQTASRNSQTQQMQQVQNDDVLFKISSAAEQISKIADTKEKQETKPRSKESSKSDAKELKIVHDEIAKLGDKVKLIQNMMWEEKAPALDQAIPPEFAEIYRLTSQSGINTEHLNEIMQLTLEHMPASMKENSTTVKRYFQTLLRKIIPVRRESMPKNGAKKVIMLIGPTGVGKTTSIAKLAARYSYLLEKKYKVGLIVLDTYRIGAVEQLMQYARMMKLAIETVVDPPEFTSALNSLKYCDYILIDTMGSSPYDKTKIETIAQCLEENSSDLHVEVTLVMPSSIKYEDLKSTYDNFSSLGIDTMMFTKLDETRGFGNIFSLSYETKKPISYFSVGQEVPEDLVLASSDILIDFLLHGFNRGSLK